MYPYYYYQGSMNGRQNDKMAADIAKAINGEYGAVQCYQKLSEMASNQKEKDQILEIRQDEIKHFQQFSQIYMNLTGQQHQAQMTEDCPNTYKEGLDFSFNDEQDTVDFYLDIAEQTSDPTIKEVFKRAAGDEQNHAVWFLYFLNKQK
ncbi:ferritin-like domain-containing protein [Bacillus sp. ISL-47]|uniref:ferritin-like domain-containing protein n=1 Tax=Bacillus sp. ISL-47 TaxID=2819130 RepID=UPI001BECF793|nr:ferritin-like domain-containing protein [Bacillus sp. ISL-47]MBT2688767.1 ferritin-like domain-containing protein [Bacillus sp. ISL-47]MBT2709939.1 ferritin-like domain-containing protein [Pseudomonas sp. ISL-84]